MEKKIFLKEVLEIMKLLDDDKKPVSFGITVRTFNLQNKTGGNIRYYPNATLLQPPAKKGVKRLAMDTPFKNPNHFENRTRNIKTHDGIKKINILFIIEFNGKKVVY